MLHLRPDMASLATGSCNFPTIVYENPPAFVRGLATQMRDLGVRPEIEVFDLAMLYNAADLVAEGLIPPAPHVQFVMGVKHALPARRDILEFEVAKLRELLPDATFTAAGIGRHQMEVARWSLALGGHCSHRARGQHPPRPCDARALERRAGAPRRGALRPPPPPRRDRCTGAPAPGASGAGWRRTGRLTSAPRRLRPCSGAGWRATATGSGPSATRWRGTMTPAAILDLIAVFIFALTGGLVASRAQLDIVGFLFLGCLTGVGGGTLRDLVLGRDPVFWVGSPHYLAVACAAAILAFFTAHRLESRYQAIVWLDALALSVAAAAGVSIAREAGASWPIILVMGVATGTFGGLMRDVVTNEIPLVLRQGELYVSACLAGALLSVLLLHLFPAAETLSLLTASVATFVLRAGSLRFGWRLPVYRPRAPRTFPPRSAASTARAPDSAGEDGGAAKR